MVPALLAHAHSDRLDHTCLGSILLNPSCCGPGETVRNGFEISFSSSLAESSLIGSGYRHFAPVSACF